MDDVSRDTAKSHRYHCISCGAEMIPKLGNLREHHFAHKAACSCNSETYLHKLGKILLKKKWDESPEFYIRYMQRVKCGKYKDCVFYKDNVCEDSMLSEKYDLEEFYDTCDVERSVGEFKPDLYLYHSGFSNRRGVFIEIKVTHESTDKKKNSENKINTWREDKFERSVANGTETVFVTLRFCVVRKQLKATLKPNAAGVQLPPHYYRNG